jgi:hypothetical protein
LNPKKIDRRKITGQLGINLIERIVLRMGYAWHSSNAELDAGIDGIIETCDPATSEATNCILQVQSKSLAQFTAETETSFEFLCDERDLQYWLAGNAPVILVVSRRDSDEAYWVPIKDYFSTHERRKERRIRFDKRSNRFDDSCAESLRKLAVPRELGVYFSPRPCEERLISNLFRVTQLPDIVYSAETAFRFPGQVWSHVRTNRLTVSGEWILHGKQMISVHSLSEAPWNTICDSASVRQQPADCYALSNSRDQQNLFVRLLLQCLKEKLSPLRVGFNPDRNLFYFRPTPKLTPRKLAYASLKEAASRVVFGPYQSKTTSGRTAYYRHSAFVPAFLRFDDIWYLQVTPTYLFTSDGYRESRYAAERLSGIKRLERNSAVLGQLLMWAECLTSDPTLYEPDYPFLTFARPEFFALPVGLDDSQWLPGEEDENRPFVEQDIQQARLFEP